MNDMRSAGTLAGFMILAAAAAGTARAAPPPDKPARAEKAAATPSAVPADVRARVVSKLHGANPADVTASPIPGLYEVTMGGLIAYVSADGKFLVSGNIYDLDTETNLTAERRNAARAKALAALRDDQMIIFSPENPKMTVTVFTDVDCGYCRKFHSQIAEINKAGVRVRYLLFPRTGPGTESWRKAESVWCAADRKDALTRAKRGEPVKSKDCGDAALKAQYDMGGDLGVEGTPAIFTQSGEYIGGYLTPSQLVQLLQETPKTADASR
jgi:thiol:disulfide interchange protein DsbC